MKTTEYRIYYTNDLQEVFYAMSFQDAIIMAMADAISKGRDKRIKYVVDENGLQVYNPQVTYSYKLETF